MYPEICKIGPFTIYSYGVMLALGFMVSIYLAGNEAVKEKLSRDLVFNFAFVALVSGVFGARIFYVVEHFGFYSQNPLEIIMFNHGGLSWFGGLFLGIISSIAYLRIQGVPVYKIFDLITPFLALSQAFGRLGCFLNGCCFGNGLFLIPVQIYSSFFLILIFIVLRILQSHPHRAGAIFYSYLMLYSTKRFFMEFWRQDNPNILWDLSLFQIISILVFAVASVKILLLRKNNP